MTAKRVCLALQIATSVTLGGICGCEGLTPPESVLAGTWELIPNETPDPKLADWLLTFDFSGRLKEVSFTFGDRTVTWNDPPSSASVDGEAVHISVTHDAQRLAFDGTLDSATAPTSADGSLTANVVVDDVEVSDAQGQATLVKQ